MSSKSSGRLKTNFVHAGRDPHNNHGVVNPPVYHASTILQPSLDKFEAARKPDWSGYRYGRSGTPTSRYFEDAIADIYGGYKAMNDFEMAPATQPTVPAEPQPAEVTADAGAQPAGQEELV